MECDQADPLPGCELGRCPGQGAVSGGGQVLAGQLIGDVAVLTGGNDQQPRVELVEDRTGDGLEALEVLAVAGTRWHRQVHGESPSFPDPHLVDPAATRIERPLVEGDEQHRRVVVEDVLGPVAVVDVPVKHRDAIDPQ